MVPFPGLRDFLGAAYGFYAVCAVLSLLFVWRWVEETKGKSLEDMQSDVLRRQGDAQLNRTAWKNRCP